MLTYIVRRLLYSIPVLLVSTFLSFTFVSLAGDPVAKLRGNPRLPATTVHNIIVQNHLNRSIPVRYWYWLEGRVHAQARHLARDAPADLAGHHADDRAHGAGDHHRGVARARPRRRRRHLLGDPPVLGLRLLLHVAQLPRLRDADLLAGAAAADPLRRHLPEVERAHLLHVGAEQPASRDVVARPAAAHRAAGDDAHDHQLRAVQPLHAGVDARRDQHRLRAHRAREGPLGVARDHAPRLPQRADPDRDGRRAQLRRPARRRDRHRDDLPARRDGLLLRPEARRRSTSTPSWRGSLVTSVDHHRLQPVADILYGYLDPRIRYD